MQKGRLESFSDGVLAISITIMVLQLKVPHGATFAALRPGLPVFLGYVLSFVYVGIYWTNHYSLLASARKIDGRVLWPNLHLLFWLSLVLYATDWMGKLALRRPHWRPMALCYWPLPLHLSACRSDYYS